MDYNFLPFLLIIVSLAVMLTIIIKKFPQLSLLDVENIPEVKEERKKNEYLKKRAMQKAEASKKAWSIVFFHPIFQWLKQRQLKFRQYVGSVERKAIAHMKERQKSQSLPVQHEQGSTIKSMLHEAALAYQQGDYEGAERTYIAVIRMDARNVDAYAGLGDVYFVQQQWKEAKETYQFLLHLRPNDEHALVKLAEIAEEEGNTEQAVQYYEQAVLLNDQKSPRYIKIAELLKSLGQYDTALEAVQQAVDIEPENPKYLDLLVEISILVGDKTLAEEAYQQLRKVNPENQKLPILKDKIEQLPKR